MTIQMKIVENFSNIIARGRLQHAYIFEGGAGTGKLDTAIYIAQMMMCQNVSDAGMPDRTCSVCQRISQKIHPDVIMIEAENQSIKVDTVREIKKEFAQSGMESRQKILIIDGIDQMTISAANSLLKFLEEPDGEVTIFLITAELQKLLPTIISRAQIVHFPSLTVPEKIDHYKSEGLSEEQAHLLARIPYDLKTLDIYEDSADFFKKAEDSWRLFRYLSTRDDQAIILIHSIFNGDKKSNMVKRIEAELMLDLLIAAFRDLITLKCGQDATLAYLKYRTELESVALKSTLPQILQSTKILLQAKDFIGANVSVQSIFEWITIEMMDLDV